MRFAEVLYQWELCYIVRQAIAAQQAQSSQQLLFVQLWHWANVHELADLVILQACHNVHIVKALCGKLLKVTTQP